MTSLPTCDDYVKLINDNKDPKIEKFRADLLKLVEKLRKLREEKLPLLDLHSEIVAWIKSPTAVCPELRLVCSTCYVDAKPNAFWSLATLTSKSKKVSDPTAISTTMALSTIAPRNNRAYRTNASNQRLATPTTPVRAQPTPSP